MVEHTVSRRFTWVVASLVAISAAVACGDDGGDDVSDSNEGGEGGTSNAGRGGGGRGGNSPSGGTGGTGTGTAGSQGVAGTAAGTTGSGGTDTVTGGSTSGGSSSGGTTTSGGTSGTGNTPEAGSGGDPGPGSGGGGDGGTSGEGGSGGALGGSGGEGGEENGGTGGDGGSGGGAVNFDYTVSPSLFPLAPGGVNIVDASFVNSSSVPVEVTLTATPPTGATVQPATQPVDLPAGGNAEAYVVLRGTDVATGNGTLSLTASADGVADKRKTVDLVFMDNMARNTVGSPYPKAFASSFQAARPPALAFDASDDMNTETSMWVSSGTEEGQGPLPNRPEWLGVDFGASVAIGRVEVVQRKDRGPKTFDIEVSDDGQAWTIAETVPLAEKAVITETIIDPPRTARYLRLLITASHDPGGPSCPDPCDPPRNVQIAGLRVYAP